MNVSWVFIISIFITTLLTRLFFFDSLGIAVFGCILFGTIGIWPGISFQNYAMTTQPEKRILSLRKAALGIPVGIFVGITSAILLFSLVDGITLGLVTAMTFFFIFGFGKSNEVGKRLSPNQGIRTLTRNAIVIFVFHISTCAK